MAYNLNEYLKAEIPPYPKAVVADLLRQCKILQLLPIETISKFTKVGLRWQTLPNAGTRKINAGYTEGTGTTEPITDTLHAYGGDILVDRLLQMADAVEKPLVTQTKMKVAALGYTLSNDFINGDHAADPDTLEGLKKRVSNMASRQTINAAGAADSLKVLASEANEQLFLDALHTALEYVQGPGEIVMWMNLTSKIGLGKVLRRVKLLATTQDQYGRTWDTFGPAKLVDVGNQADQSTEIISDTELADDGGADSTSIYVTRVNPDDGVHFIQLKGSSFLPYDPVKAGEGGVSGQGPQNARRIDTGLGLSSQAKYCIARVYNFKMAAA